VAERYYLKDEQVKTLMNATKKHQEKGNGFAFKPHTPEDDYAYTIQVGGKGCKTDNFLQEPCVETVGQYDSSQNSRIIDPNGISQAVINGEKDGSPKIAEPIIASMKSRDKDNPTGVRTANNGNFAQRLEPSADQSTSNTITSVAKDNLLAEPAIIEDFYPDRPARVYEEQAPTIRSDRTGLKVTEPAVLGWTRNEKGEITDRHPVEVANCVTAAKRDNTQNYVVEPQVQQVCNLIGDREGKFANPQRGRIDSPAGLAPAVDTAQGGNHVAKIIEQAKTAHPSRGIILIKNTPCWVRRLTERELFRLMDVDENDIDTLLNAGISNTQLTKLAGNSIVTACMYHIFHALFIETTPPPNTQTQLF
jgi:site-specific DNA-cytosine methylase